MLTSSEKKLFFSLPDRVAYWLPEFELVLFKLEIPAGETKLVYTPQEGDGFSGHIDEGGIGELQTVTIIAPGGCVYIHSPVLESPGVWEGSLEQTGYGLIMKSEFHYEGIVDSEWRCLGPRAQQRLPEGRKLSRQVLQAGESFVFGEETVGIVSLYGTSDWEAFKGNPGDSFTADVQTLLAIYEVTNV